MNEEWVLTVNRITGEVFRIEKLDSATGERSELSEEEYAALGCRDFTAHQTETEAAEEIRAGNDGDAYERGYRQAVADYEAALLGLKHGMPRFR